MKFLLSTFSNLLGVLFTYLVAFFAPINIWIALVGLFVFADFVTALLKAHKLGEKISSKKMFTSIPKFIAYGTAVIIAHALFLTFFPEFPAVKLITGFIAYIELKSIDENFKAITGHSFFKSFIDKLNPKK